MGFADKIYRYNPQTMPQDKTVLVVFGFSKWQVENISSRKDSAEFLNAYSKMKTVCDFLAKERPDIIQLFITGSGYSDGVDHPIGFAPNQNAVSLKFGSIDKIKLSDIPVSSDVTHFLLAGNSILTSIQNLGLKILERDRTLWVRCISDCAVASTSSKLKDLDDLYNKSIISISGSNLIGSNNMPPADALLRTPTLLDKFSGSAVALAQRARDIGRTLHL